VVNLKTEHRSQGSGRGSQGELFAVAQPPEEARIDRSMASEKADPGAAAAFMHQLVGWLRSGEIIEQARKARAELLRRV